MTNGKFYWLKLKKDFFKRHDIRIIESMPQGHVSVLFYLKLMLESVDHEGELRFSNKVPYSAEMLATITETDVEVVKESLERLQTFGMIEITQDGTIIIDKVKTMIGSASDTDEARRSKRYRERKKAECDESSRTNVTNRHGKCDESSREIEIENRVRDRDRDRDRDRYFFSKNNGFVPPTIEEICSYCESRHNGINPQNFYDYYSAKNWTLGNSNKQMSDWKAAIRAWETNQKRYTEDDI